METGSYVLLVEDEDSIRLALKEFLTNEGFSVLVASDGVGAIKHLLDYNVRHIISDYRMDVLGGDYWVRFLRRFCPQIKVLLTSGFLDAPEEVPFEILQKPYSFHEIVAHLRATSRS